MMFYTMEICTLVERGMGARDMKKHALVEKSEKLLKLKEKTCGHILFQLHFIFS